MMEKDTVSMRVLASTDVIRRVLAPVRAKPTCHSIDVDAIAAKNSLLAHCCFASEVSQGVWYEDDSRSWRLEGGFIAI